MTWRERLNRYTQAERVSRLEARVKALETRVDAKFAAVEDRLSRIVWQCRRIVTSVVKQFTGRADD